MSVRLREVGWPSRAETWSEAALHLLLRQPPTAIQWRLGLPNRGIKAEPQSGRPSRRASKRLCPNSVTCLRAELVQRMTDLFGQLGQDIRFVRM